MHSLLSLEQSSNLALTSWDSNLLRRHYLIHNETKDLWGDLASNEPKPATASDKLVNRPRLDPIAVACTHCAKAKVECDRKVPCQQCLTKGLTCSSWSSRRHKPTSNRLSLASPSSGQRDDSSVAASDTSYLAQSRAFRESPSHTEGRLDLALCRSEELPQARTITPGRNDTQPEFINRQSVDIDIALRPYTNTDPYYVNSNQVQTVYNEDGMDDTVLMIVQRNLFQNRTLAEPNLTDTHGLSQPRLANDNVTSSRTISEPRCASSSQLFPAKANDSRDPHPEWAHWWICRCTALPLSPPAPPADLAMSSLENLADLAEEPEPWTNSDDDWRKRHFGIAEFITNIPISEATREYMLVILQRFLRIAVEVHGLDLDLLTIQHDDGQHDDVGTDYLRLPPNKALYIFMELFLRTFEPYYPLLPGRSLDPNKLGKNNSKSKALMLLLLSMLACGSMVDPAPKARRFSTVISEICRLSMANISCKNPSATTTPIFLYCALLSTIKGAFSGVKLHMSVSITHRNVYLTVSILLWPSPIAGVIRCTDFWHR